MYCFSHQLDWMVTNLQLHSVLSDKANPNVDMPPIVSEIHLLFDSEAMAWRMEGERASEWERVVCEVICVEKSLMHQPPISWRCWLPCKASKSNRLLMHCDPDTSWGRWNMCGNLPIDTSLSHFDRVFLCSWCRPLLFSLFCCYFLQLGAWSRGDKRRRSLFDSSLVSVFSSPDRRKQANGAEQWTTYTINGLVRQCMCALV